MYYNILQRVTVTLAYCTHMHSMISTCVSLVSALMRTCATRLVHPPLPINGFFSHALCTVYIERSSMLSNHQPCPIN